VARREILEQDLYQPLASALFLERRGQQVGRVENLDAEQLEDASEATELLPSAVPVQDVIE
jgi:hypothetical protein